MTAHSKYVNLSTILPQNLGMFDARFAWTRHARSNGSTAEHLHAAYVFDRAEAYYDVISRAFCEIKHC